MGLSCKGIKNACQTREPHPLLKINTHTYQDTVCSETHASTQEHTSVHPRRREGAELLQWEGLRDRNRHNILIQREDDELQEKESVLEAIRQGWEMSLLATRIKTNNQETPNTGQLFSIFSFLMWQIVLDLESLLVSEASSSSYCMAYSNQSSFSLDWKPTCFHVIMCSSSEDSSRGVSLAKCT